MLNAPGGASVTQAIFDFESKGSTTLMHRYHQAEISQKSAHSSLYYIKRLQRWLLRILCLSTCMHCYRRAKISQKSARFSLYHVIWPQCWLLRILGFSTCMHRYPQACDLFDSERQLFTQCIVWHDYMANFWDFFCQACDLLEGAPPGDAGRDTVNMIFCWYNTLQHTATHCNTLQHTATHVHTVDIIFCLHNTLQHIAIRCNTLQHTM